MDSRDRAVVSPLSDALELFLKLAGAANKRPLLFVKLTRHVVSFTHVDERQALAGDPDDDDD